MHDAYICARKQGHQHTAFQLKPRLLGRKVDERRALIGLFTMAGHRIIMNNNSVRADWVLLLFVYLHAVFERDSRPCARHVALCTATGGALCVLAAVMCFSLERFYWGGDTA